jgi:hypothetical protein
MPRPKTITEGQKAAAMDFIRPDALETEFRSATTEHIASPADDPSDDMGLSAHRAIEAKRTAPKYTPAPAHRAPLDMLQHPPVPAPADMPPMSGELRGDAIDRFIQGGSAIFTITSRKTGTRFTYQFSRPDADGSKPRPIWVRVLTGPDNTSDFTFAGTFWPAGDGWEYRRSAKVSLSDTAASLVAVKWFMDNIYNTEKLAALMDVHHAGRCCRCGRRLTVPSSVESGIGPDCAAKM